jgi:primosomal protein N'
VPLADVYPLVSTRSLARAFTYEVPDDVTKGAVVAVRIGRSSARGVVTDVGVELPPGVRPVAVGRVLDQVPATLVDLALWIADYYGSTPARALSLVAPTRRAPRGERPSPSARESLAGEPEPASLTDAQTAGATYVSVKRRLPNHI